MRIDLYGMTFDGPAVTYYLWSPWRCTALEHRLFEAVKALPNVEFEQAPDELRLHVTDSKAFKSSLQLSERVLKGWQEEASDSGTDRRSWRWMAEADTDAHGYDHASRWDAVFPRHQAPAWRRPRPRSSASPGWLGKRARRATRTVPA